MMQRKLFKRNSFTARRAVENKAMAQELRQKHNMKVPRDFVYHLMTDPDLQGLKQRMPGRAKKATKGHLITTGSNWTHSFDGHD